MNMKIVSKILPVLLFFLFERAGAQYLPDVKPQAGFLIVNLLPANAGEQPADTTRTGESNNGATKPGGVHWNINWWYYPAGLFLLALALAFSLRRRHLRRKGEQEKDI